MASRPGAADPLDWLGKLLMEGALDDEGEDLEVEREGETEG